MNETSRPRLKSRSRLRSRGSISSASSAGSILDFLRPGTNEMNKTSLRPVQSTELLRKRNTISSRSKSFNNSLKKMYMQQNISAMIPMDMKDSQIPSKYHTFDGSPFNIVNSSTSLSSSSAIHESRTSINKKPNQHEISVILGEQGKVFPSRVPTSREEVEWLKMSLTSMLDTYRNNVGQEPRRAAQRAMRKGNTNMFMKVIQPEISILEKAMDELTRQVTVQCEDRGELLLRVHARQRNILADIWKMVSIIQNTRHHLERECTKMKNVRDLLRNCLGNLSNAIIVTDEDAGKVTDEDDSSPSTPPQRRKELQWIRFYRDLNKIQEQQASNDYHIISDVAKRIKDLQRQGKQIRAESECAAKRQKDAETQYSNLKSKFEGESSAQSKMVKSLKRQIKINKLSRDKIVDETVNSAYARAQEDCAAEMERTRKQKEKIQRMLDAALKHAAALRKSSSKENHDDDIDEEDDDELSSNVHVGIQCSLQEVTEDISSSEDGEEESKVVAIIPPVDTEEKASQCLLLIPQKKVASVLPSASKSSAPAKKKLDMTAKLVSKLANKRRNVKKTRNTIKAPKRTKEQLKNDVQLVERWISLIYCRKLANDIECTRLGIKKSRLPNFVRIVFSDIFHDRFVMEVMLSDFARTIDFSLSDSKRVRTFKRYWVSQLDKVDGNTEESPSRCSSEEEFELYLMLCLKVRQGESVLFPIPKTDPSFVSLSSAEKHVSDFLSELHADPQESKRAVKELKGMSISKDNSTGIELEVLLQFLMKEWRDEQDRFQMKLKTRFLAEQTNIGDDLSFDNCFKILKAAYENMSETLAKKIYCRALSMASPSKIISMQMNWSGGSGKLAPRDGRIQTSVFIDYLVQCTCDNLDGPPRKLNSNLNSTQTLVEPHYENRLMLLSDTWSHLRVDISDLLMKPKGLELKELVQPFHIEVNNFVKENLLKVIRKEADLTFMGDEEKEFWIKLGKLAAKSIRLRS